jgi:hypothetical protein
MEQQWCSRADRNICKFPRSAAFAHINTTNGQRLSGAHFNSFR